MEGRQERDEEESENDFVVSQKKASIPFFISLSKPEQSYSSTANNSGDAIRSFACSNTSLACSCRPFLECARVRFAARHGEEVAAIDMDRRCDVMKRIRNRMDHRFAERNSLLETKRLSALTMRPFFAPPIKRIVLAPGINSNYRPHSMIMRIQ